jgi:DNA invertase Pin-like site-specific DNA recombinase
VKQAYSFIRWSRPEQARGDTLRRQQAASASLCERRGWTLTELPPLSRSGFTGAQRTVGPLAEFLKLAEAGRIPVGSVLIVESLDRLTRERLKTAVSFFLRILDAGVSIATTSPEYIYDSTNSEMPDMMFALAILSRGNEESELKSQRVGAAWANKRKNASVQPMTKTCPAWLRLRPDRTAYDLVPDRAAVVRRIFRMSLDGYGAYTIAKVLNKERVPVFTAAKGWGESYVTRVLKNRACIGEFQPATRSGSVSVPQGQPIPNYFPPVVSEADFAAAQQAFVKRHNGGGRLGRQTPNLFGKVLVNARDGKGFVYISSKPGHTIAKLQPIGARAGLSAPLSLTYKLLEDTVLTYLSEVSADDLTGQRTADTARDLQAQLDDLDKRIEILKSKLDGQSELLSDLLDRLSLWRGQRRELQTQLDAAQHTTPASSHLRETQSVLPLLRDADPETAAELRTKLKYLILCLVEKITVLVVDYDSPASRKKTRGAAVHMQFRDGHSRTLLLTYESGAKLVLDDAPMLPELLKNCDLDTAEAVVRMWLGGELKVTRYNKS